MVQCVPQSVVDKTVTIVTALAQDDPASTPFWCVFEIAYSETAIATGVANDWTIDGLGLVTLAPGS